MSKEGWNYLYNSIYWHYFVEGRSLCGKWMILGDNSDAETGNDNSSDNCKACRKKLEKGKKIDNSKLVS